MRKQSVIKINYARTGILPIDIITCGKGLPLRRLIHFWSQPGVGTSTIIYTAVKNMIRNGEKVLWAGVEPTQALAESMGLSVNGQCVEGFKYVELSYWDELEDITNAFLNLDSWRFMVIDSLSAISPDPERFMRKRLESNTVSQEIRIQTSYLSAYHALLKKTDKSIIFTTHASTKFATMPNQRTKIVAHVLLMLNLPFWGQAYKVCQEPAFCVRQYSCLLIHAVCNFSLRSASRTAVLP